MNWKQIRDDPKLSGVLTELFFAQPLSRDKLPYSVWIDRMRADFYHRTGQSAEPREFWLALLAVGKRRKLSRKKERVETERKRKGKGFFA